MTMDFQIRKGDIFFTQGTGFVSSSILKITAWWSADSAATYSHTGIFLDSEGKTVEALPSGIKSQDFFKAYKGKKVFIVRPIQDPDLVDAALKKVMADHFGEIYPTWRLPLFIFPPLARICASGILVCSEFVGKFLWLAKLRHDHFKGTAPDTLVDEVRDSRHFDIIFEGGI
jgi:hypothetical protein